MKRWHRILEWWGRQGLGRRPCWAITLVVLLLAGPAGAAQPLGISTTCPPSDCPGMYVADTQALRVAGSPLASELPWTYSLLVLDSQPPTLTLCSISAAGKYQRGETLRSLSCMDFYGRIIAYGTLTDVQHFGAFACWTLDPCGWPK